jgi:hypothetical protein
MHRPRKSAIALALAFLSVSPAANPQLLLLFCLSFPKGICFCSRHRHHLLGSHCTLAIHSDPVKRPPNKKVQSSAVKETGSSNPITLWNRRPPWPVESQCMSSE